MFYAAWKNIKNGNINCAYSKNALNWTKLRQNIFNIQNPIKIISEPYLIKKKNKIFIFFEYKKNGFWNISYKLIDSKVFKIEKK